MAAVVDLVGGFRGGPGLLLDGFKLGRPGGPACEWARGWHPPPKIETLLPTSRLASWANIFSHPWARQRRGSQIKPQKLLSEPRIKMVTDMASGW